MTIGIKKFKAKHIYYLYSAVNGLMFTLAFTLGMVYQVRTVGLNPFQLVVVGTTLEFSALIFEIPTGIMADLVSRRASVIFGSFVTGVARLIEGLVPTYGGMLMAQVTWGFGYTFISGALTAWITDEVGEDKVEAILLEGTQISAIAEGVGIVLAVLLSMIALKWPILLSGVLFILLAGLMILFMPETNFEKSSEGPIRLGLGLDTFKQSFGLIRASRFLLVFALVIFLIGLSSEGFDRLYTPLMLSHLDLNVVDGMGEEMWFGILRGGVLVMSLGLTQLVKHWRTLENSPKLGMILAGMMIVQIIGVLVVANTHALWVFFLAFWLVNGLRQTTYPLQTAWVIQFIPAKMRATVLSMTEQMDQFGQTIGGMPIGYIGQRFTIGLAISVTTVFLVPVVGLYVWLTGMAVEKVELEDTI